MTANYVGSDRSPARDDPQVRRGRVAQAARTGAIGIAYDPHIADVFKATPPQDVDLLPLWDRIACPTLAAARPALRSVPACVAEEMTRRGPKARLVDSRASATPPGWPPKTRSRRCAISCSRERRRPAFRRRRGEFRLRRVRPRRGGDLRARTGGRSRPAGDGGRAAGGRRRRCRARPALTRRDACSISSSRAAPRRRSTAGLALAAPIGGFALAFNGAATDPSRLPWRGVAVGLGLRFSCGAALARRAGERHGRRVRDPFPRRLRPRGFRDRADRLAAGRWRRRGSATPP